jgi:hypothetical protein
MRARTLVLLFASLSSLITGCGSDSKDSSSSSSAPPLELPEIVQGPANPISYQDGEFVNAFSFVDDQANDRWLIADKAQGVIAVNKTTDARSVLIPIAASNNNSPLVSIADMALDVANGVLYLLDVNGEKIIAADINTGALETPLTRSDFDDLADAGWNFPTSLFYDQSNNRLLIADRSGLELTSSAGNSFGAFAIFIYTPTTDNLSIMAEAENRADPFTSTDIFDIYFDSANSRVIASGIFYADITSSAPVYTGLIIPENDWENSFFFYIDGETTTTVTAAHDVAYDPISQTAYLLDSTADTIKSFNLTTSSLTVSPTIVSDGNDGEDYPFTRPTSIAFDTELGLLIFDEAKSSLTALNTPFGENVRSLVLSGRPISADPLALPQIPLDLEVDPGDGALLISDRNGAQADALRYDGAVFSPWEFDIDVASITPETITLTDPGDGTVPTPPSIVAPKPAFFSSNPAGDLFIFGLSFQIPTADPFTTNFYREAVYKRAAGESTAKPVTQVTTDGVTSLRNFSTIFTPSELRGLAVVNEGIYFLYHKAATSSAAERSFILFWNAETTSFQFVTDTTGLYNPRIATGFAANGAGNALYFTDSSQDAVIKISINSTASSQSYVYSVASGRQNSGDAYLAIPSGLAINAEETKAWVFENTIRALVEIDLTTGERSRIDSPINYISAAETISLSDDGSALYIVDKSVNRVIEVNLSTGVQRWIDK